MSKLSNLMGKPKTFKIGDIELEIKPRTLEDIDLIVGLADESKRGEALKELVIRTLKDSVPDATDEEINKIALQYFQQLTEAIMEVNGLKNVTPPTAS